MILQYLIMIINNWVEILRNGSPICELVTGSPEFWLLKITFSYLLASYHACPWKQTSLVISFNISTPHATSETRETPVETFHCNDVTLQDPCNVSIDCGHYAYLLGVSRLRNACFSLDCVGSVEEWAMRAECACTVPHCNVENWDSTLICQTVYIGMQTGRNISEGNVGWALNVFSLNVD